jgi:hypothetical protein
VEDVEEVDEDLRLYVFAVFENPFESFLEHKY